MKYSTDSAMKEILKRSSQLKAARERRIRIILSVAAGVCLAALVLIIAIFPGQALETGGYVLAIAIAFALGVIAALLCLYWKNKKKTEGSESEEGQVMGLEDQVLTAVAGGTNQSADEPDKKDSNMNAD